MPKKSDNTADQLLATTEEMLYSLEHLPNVAKKAVRKYHRVVPGRPDQIGDFLEISEDAPIWMDGEISDLETPLNFSTMRRIIEAKDNKESFCLSNARQITNLKQVRGKVLRLLPQMVQIDYAWIKQRGKCFVQQAFMGLQNGYWVSIGHNDRVVMEEQEDNFIQVSIGCQFNRQFYWEVALGWEGTPTLAFQTDPVGVKEVFRLRDIPTGKQRRTALMHWVKEHWRGNKEEDDGIKIESYLRGESRFAWNGLVCEVYPSLDDLQEFKKRYPGATRFDHLLPRGPTNEPK